MEKISAEVSQLILSTQLANHSSIPAFHPSTLNRSSHHSNLTTTASVFVNNATINSTAIFGDTTTRSIARDIVPAGSTRIPTTTTTAGSIVAGSITAGGTTVATSGRISFAEGTIMARRTTAGVRAVTAPRSVHASEESAASGRGAVCGGFAVGGIGAEIVVRG